MGVGDSNDVISCPGLLVACTVAAGDPINFDSRLRLMSKANWVFALTLCACLEGVPFARGADERVLYNGKVFTGEPERPYAEAVAIRGDKIVAVGNRREVSQAVARGA